MAPVRRIALALVTPLVATLILPAPASAQGTYTWSGTLDNAWLTAGNWSGPSATFPGNTNNGALANGNAGDTAVFASTIPSGNIAGIDMGLIGGGTAAALQLGAITFSNPSGGLAIGNSSSASAGTLRLNGATVNGQVETILSNTSGSQTLTIQNSVGTGTQPTTVLLGSLSTGSVGYVVASTGSTINISAVIFDGFTPKGITIQGGGTLILSGANTYTGPTLVTSGTLHVTNTAGSATGAGTVAVASPARLSGTGTIFPTLGDVQVGGRLQPGSDTAAGTLTVTSDASITGASSQYIWSLSNSGTGFASAPANGASDAAGQSRLAVNGGNLTFQPSTINVTGLSGLSFDNTKFYSWTVATATGTIAPIASQPTFSTTGLNTGGGTFTLTSGIGGVFLAFSPVPEPAAILLCCVVSAGVTGYIRRKRAAR